MWQEKWMHPDLLTPVLQVAHQRFLDAVKLGELNIDSLACALKICGALREVLAPFNAC